MAREVSNSCDGAEIIFSYSRRQAIEDGALVEVDERTSKEAGFTRRVALTRAVWDDAVEWTEEDTNRKRGGCFQDSVGRLWDVLCLARFAIRVSRDGSRDGSQLRYRLRRVPRDGRGRMARKIILKMVCGPGDDMEPVITIMQPNED